MSNEHDFLIGGVGLENLRPDEMGRPWLKIAQDMSPEVKKEEAAFIPGLETGQIFHSAAQKIYGSSVTVIFLAYKRLWTLFSWGTDGKNGEFIGLAEPDSFPVNKDNFSLWEAEQDGQKIRVREGYNFAVLIKGDEYLGPAIMPFFGMGNNDAKNILAKLNSDAVPVDDAEAPGGKRMNRLAIFAREWTLTTKYVKNDAGQGYYLYGDGKRATQAKRSEHLISPVYFKTWIEPIYKGVHDSLTVVDQSVMRPALEGPDPNTKEL